jgi:glycosyltransferase involved in cell wall biosynthesis
MRILIVHNRYTQRGGEDVVFEAETALLRVHGHEVFTWETYNDQVKGQSAFNAAANAIWSLDSQKELSALLQKYRPEVVHFHNTFLRISPAAYYTCQEAGVPVVQTLHNYRLLCPAANLLRDGKVCEACLGNWGLWPSIRYGCWHSSSAQTAVVAAMLVTHRWLKTWQNQVDLYVAMTNFARQKFIEAGIPEEKIVVKPNFIAPAKELPAAPLPKEPFALFVGRLSPEKGPELVIRAWESLPDIPIKLVGDGYLAPQLKEAVRQFGDDRVEFCGQRSQEEVYKMMGEARLLLVPSIGYEGMPLTLIEAFSHHLPVIATRHGAMQEIVQHGTTGLHFKPQDAADLAYWVRWAWEHPAEMKVMADRGFLEFQEKYSPEANYQQLMNIYQRAITKTTKAEV